MEDYALIMNKTSDEFTSLLLSLCNLYKKYDKNDIDIEEIIRLIRASRAFNHNEVIEECGPYLYKYESPIINKEKEWYLKPKLDKVDLDKVKQSENNQLAHRFITKSKIFYSKRNEAEQNDLMNKIQSLLNLYLEYSIAQKSL